MKEQFAASVILYHPKAEDIKNIETYLSKVSKLYVYDNTESSNCASLFENYTTVIYHWDGENQGIAKRLNQACSNAIEDGYAWLLTMDQDSNFDETNIDAYFKSILNYEEPNQVAVFGLEYCKQDITESTPKHSEVDHLITSGSVVNLKLYSSIGGFDENLFIDGVDIDYSYAALVKGYKNIKFGQLYFNHSLGEMVKRGSITSLYLIKSRKNIHSPIRVYYMQRNMLYLKNKYHQLLPTLIKKTLKSHNHQIRKNIKYADNLLKTLKYYFKGNKDFKLQNMGKLRGTYE